MIEVMIAMSILAVGLIAMLAMSVTALHSGRVGRDVTVAARVAQDRMEDLQRLPWADPQVQPTGGWTALNPQATAMVSAGGGGVQVFNLQRRITAVPGNANLRTIDVRVNWVEPNDPPGAPPKRYAISSVRHNDP
jgi:Tfp pilus assembly protein PilV